MQKHEIDDEFEYETDYSLLQDLKDSGNFVEIIAQHYNRSFENND